jgi:anti-anti-sigma regulatory factor
MLKINEKVSEGGEVVLEVEGRVIGPWVRELDRSCADVMTRGATLSVDLSSVSFVDARGIELLGRLGTRGVRLVNCSRFVAEQLRAARETHR